jgi:hypothetical protein
VLIGCGEAASPGTKIAYCCKGLADLSLQDRTRLLAYSRRPLGLYNRTLASGEVEVACRKS